MTSPGTGWKMALRVRNFLWIWCLAFAGWAQACVTDICNKPQTSPGSECCIGIDVDTLDVVVVSEVYLKRVFRVCVKMFPAHANWIPPAHGQHFRLKFQSLREYFLSIIWRHAGMYMSLLSLQGGDANTASGGKSTVLGGSENNALGSCVLAILLIVE